MFQHTVFNQISSPDHLQAIDLTMHFVKSLTAWCEYLFPLYYFSVCYSPSNFIAMRLWVNCSKKHDTKPHSLCISYIKTQSLHVYDLSSPLLHARHPHRVHIELSESLAVKCKMCNVRKACVCVLLCFVFFFTLQIPPLTESKIIVFWGWPKGPTLLCCISTFFTSPKNTLLYVQVFFGKLK